MFESQGKFHLTRADVDRFHDDGFLIIPDYLPPDEIARFSEIARRDREKLLNFPYTPTDAEGRAAKVFGWDRLRDDIYSAYARHEALVKPWDQFLGGPVTYYHHKMMIKQPRIGGAWEWHQDYGYWYNFGCLFPDMGSCIVAVDQATTENGCLQVLKGSHKLGRVDHVRIGEQVGADPERVKAARQRFELVAVELEPGYVLFFHGNLLQ